MKKLKVNFIEYFPSSISQMCIDKDSLLIQRNQADLQLLDLNSFQTIKNFGFSNENPLLRSFLIQNHVVCFTKNFFLLISHVTDPLNLLFRKRLETTNLVHVSSKNLADDQP